MEGMLTQLMYDVPSDPTISKVVITRECVEGTGQPILTRDPHKVNYSVKLNTGKGGQPASDSAPKSERFPISHRFCVCPPTRYG